MTDAPEAKAIYCTLVFEFDLKKLQGNPFKTNTPYGLPVAVGIGDSLTRNERLDDLLEALVRCEEMVSTHAGPPNWDWIRGVIAKARGES